MTIQNQAKTEREDIIPIKHEHVSHSAEHKVEKQIEEKKEQKQESELKKAEKFPLKLVAKKNEAIAYINLLYALVF